VQDFVDEINERYSFLQKILLNKINTDDMVSINKCSGGKVSVIGMIKTVEEKDDTFVMEIEDTTGSIKTVAQKEQGKNINKDDVVAISGNVNNKILFATKIVFPDVPLRQPNKSELPTKVSFFANHDFSKMPEFDSDYAILYNCENVERLTKEKPFTKLIITGEDSKKTKDPCLLDIDGSVLMLAFGSDPLLVLKKRYIAKNNSFFVVEPVPDIVFTDKTVDSTHENYKGISIVQNFNTVNLNNRTVDKINRP